jgi:hypothetical protein
MRPGFTAEVAEAAEVVLGSRFETWRAWWRRHALRAGAAGGLVPNVLFRRIGDDIEVSWLNRPFGRTHQQAAPWRSTAAVPARARLPGRG